MSSTDNKNDETISPSTLALSKPEEDTEPEDIISQVPEKWTKRWMKSFKACFSGNAETARAWACVTCLMLITIPVGMPLFGTSLLIDQMKEELSTSTAVIGWIVSTAWGLNAAFSPVSGAFITKDNTLSAIKMGLFFSVISLYLASLCTTPVSLFSTLGVAFGISSNLIYYAISSQAGSYFPHKHQIKHSKGASAYSLLGFALAQIVSGYVYSYILRFKTWHEVIQGTSVFMFVIGYGSLTALEALHAKSDNHNQLSRNTRRNRMNGESSQREARPLAFLFSQCSTEMKRFPSFYWLILDVLTFWLSNLIGLMFLPGEMASKGYQNEQEQIMLLQGIGGAFPRVVLPIASAIWPIKFFKCYPVKGAALGVCFLTSFALSDPWSYYVLSLGVGFSNGLAASSAFNVTQEVVGKKGNGFTWVMLAQGIGCVCGPVVGGLIYDASGSYRLAFEIASTMACISATLSVLAAISRHSKERKKSIHEKKQKRAHSSKMVPLESLSEVIYLRRNSTSYLMFEKKADKYQFSKIVDRPRHINENQLHRESVDIDEMFHGKFEVRASHLSFDSEDPYTAKENSSHFLSHKSDSSVHSRDG